MADIELTFPTGPIRGNFPRVYLKQHWSQNWTEHSEIHAMSAAWSAAPEISQAMLYYRYGKGTPFGSGTVHTFTKFTNIQRWFVKIEDIRRFLVGGPASVRQWLGVIGSSRDRIGGLKRTDPNNEPIGVQALQCYGLEFLWERHPILTGKFHDPVEDEQTCQRGLTFNKDKNRTKDKVNGRYLFEGDESKYLPFSGNSEWWSTRDIVEHLLTDHLPADSTGYVHLEPDMPASELDKLPTQDRPVIDTHGRTLFEILNQLIPRHRLMGWYLDCLTDNVTFRVFRMHKDDIALPGSGGTLPANATKKTLFMQQDPTSQVDLIDVSVDDVDQVVAQGARRRVCCSLIKQDKDPATLLQGWTADQKSDYQDGGQGEAGFPSSSEIAARERKAAEVRGRDELRDVFARFEVMRKDPQISGSDHWDFKAITDAAYEIVFAQDDDPDKVEIQFRPGIRLLSRLPLLDGIPYDGTKGLNSLTQAMALPFVERPLFVLVPDPVNTGKYKFIDKQGATNTETTAWNEDRRWSGTVSVDDDGRGVRISVTQKPRHIIGGTDFTPQSFDLIVPAADWQDFIFTVAMEDDRYCEARYPEDANLPTDVQQLRRLRIDVGDGFRLDYLVPDTVVGIDAEGSLLRSDGGRIRDDRTQLMDIARMAFDWYSSRKQILRFHTSQDHDSLRLGTMITDFEYGNATKEEVNTVVTAIKKTWPLVESEDSRSDIEPGPAVLMVETDFSELDPLRL